MGLTENTVHSQSSEEPAWLTSGSATSGLNTPPHTPSSESSSWSHCEYVWERRESEIPLSRARHTRRVIQ